MSLSSDARVERKLELEGDGDGEGQADLSPTLRYSADSVDGLKYLDKVPCVMLMTFRIVPFTTSVSRISPLRFILALNVNVGLPAARLKLSCVNILGRIGYVLSGTYVVATRVEA